MSEGKQRCNSQILGEKAVKILKDLFPTEWVTREFTPDYGLDLAVELFEPYKNGYLSTGEHIYFQVKGTEHIKLGTKKIYDRKNIEKIAYSQKVNPSKIDVVKFPIDTSLLRTVEKMGSAVPVLLIVVDVKQTIAYYVCLNDYIEKVIIPEKPNYYKQDKIVINIPTENSIQNSTDVMPIEWYAKRAKLFALFSKANYQKIELAYIDDKNLVENIFHFAKIIRRFDVWKAEKYFKALQAVREDLDYFLANKTLPAVEQTIHKHKVNSDDVDSPIWTTNYSFNEISYSDAALSKELRHLWDRICNCGRIFEDIAKEWFLPTYIGQITR